MSSSTVRPPFLISLAEARARTGSCLCLGLDPEPSRLPAACTGVEGLLAFCLRIVEATSDLVCAYKPNAAFFERFGAEGWRVLERLVAAVPRNVPVILDGKRGDIGNTSRAYADAAFDHLGTAACTVSPYLGLEAVAPILEHPGGFPYVLCRPSNVGAASLQDLDVGGRPLYARVIDLFAEPIAQGRAGLVIGAREAPAFVWADRLAPEASLLVPGVGAQGGTAEELASFLSPRQ